MFNDDEDFDREEKYQPGYFFLLISFGEESCLIS
jgi:hypothetical protein